MIAYVRGILAEIEEDSVIVDVGGIGYRVYTSVTEDLVRIGVGNKLTLHTYLNIREDAQILYGFMEKPTLKFFQQLINVSGVGPKYALAILTQMKPESAAAAIASGDYKALTKVSGIGPKTAQRIILDLKDKVGAVQAVPEELTQPAGQAVQGTAAAEAAAALESLGYTRGEAQAAIARVYREGMDSGRILKEALKQLATL